MKKIKDITNQEIKNVTKDVLSWGEKFPIETKYFEQVCEEYEELQGKTNEEVIEILGRILVEMVKKERLKRD